MGSWPGGLPVGRAGVGNGGQGNAGRPQAEEGGGSRRQQELDKRLTMRSLDGVIGMPPMMLRMFVGLFAGSLMLWSATESSSTLW